MQIWARAFSQGTKTMTASRDRPQRPSARVAAQIRSEIESMNSEGNTEQDSPKPSKQKPASQPEKTQATAKTQPTPNDEPPIADPFAHYSPAVDPQKPPMDEQAGEEKSILPSDDETTLGRFLEVDNPQQTPRSSSEESSAKTGPALGEGPALGAGATVAAEGKVGAKGKAGHLTQRSKARQNPEQSPSPSELDLLMTQPENSADSPVGSQTSTVGTAKRRRWLTPSLFVVIFLVLLSYLAGIALAAWLYSYDPNAADAVHPLESLQNWFRYHL